MKVIKEGQAGAFITGLKKRASVSVRGDDIQRVVRKIILDVQKQGDRAVRSSSRSWTSPRSRA